MVDKMEPLEFKKPKTNFTNNILKQIVGTEKAANAFNSISMASIPSGKQDKNLSLEGNLPYQNIVTSFFSSYQS